MAYEVSTPVFGGPLDLLLALVNAAQVELWEVSIAEIVNGYLGAVELAARQDGGPLDLDAATEVALVAAALIQLKCRRLLPGPDDIEADEELGAWEDRDLALTRMLECQTFARVSRCLEGLMATAARSVPRVAGLEEALVGLAPDLLAGLTPVDLLGAYLAVSAPRPVPQVEVSHLAPPRASLEEVVAALAGELSSLGRATFRYLAREAATRSDVVVVFLAVLELFKQGMVELDQIQTFGELHVAWMAGSSVPVLVGASESG